MLNLSNVTLLCIETRDSELAHWAVDRCLSGMQFAEFIPITNLECLGKKSSSIWRVQVLIIRATQDYSDLSLSVIDRYVKDSHDYIGPVSPQHSFIQ